MQPQFQETPFPPGKPLFSHPCCFCLFPSPTVHWHCLQYECAAVDLYFHWCGIWVGLPMLLQCYYEHPWTWLLVLRHMCKGLSRPVSQPWRDIWGWILLCYGGCLCNVDAQQHFWPWASRSQEEFLVRRQVPNASSCYWESLLWTNAPPAIKNNCSGLMVFKPCYTLESHEELKKNFH